MVLPKLGLNLSAVGATGPKGKASSQKQGQQILAQQAARQATVLLGGKGASLNSSEGEQKSKED